MAKPKPTAEPAALTTIELVALSKVLAPKQVDEARVALPENKTWDVDFTVRINGSLQREVGTPGSVKTVEKIDVCYFDIGHFLAVLARLKVTPAEMKRHLRFVLDRKLTPAAHELGQTLDQLAADITAKRPKKSEPRTTPATAGAIRSQLTATKVA